MMTSVLLICIAAMHAASAGDLADVPPPTAAASAEQRRFVTVCSGHCPSEKRRYMTVVY